MKQKNIIAFLIIYTLILSACSSNNSYPPFSINILDTTASAGYYFLVPLKMGTNPKFKLNHLILDAKGNVVYYKQFPEGVVTGDFKLHYNGLISYSKQKQIMLMDSTFTVIDSVTTKNGIIFDGHDFIVSPNNHFFLLGTEKVKMNLRAYPLFNKNGTVGSDTATVIAGVIQELDEHKNLVFEWHAKDHFSFTDIDIMRLNSPVNVDWNHFNAIELDTDGNLLAVSRNFNEITKINRTNGNIIWRMGGKANQFTFTNENNMFKSLHDVRRISNGNITIWDNGSSSDSPFHPGTAKEYTINEQTHTATLAWQYVVDARNISNSIGNVQRLPNGNTLVNCGATNNVKPTFCVVNSANQKIFELTFQDTLRSYRVFNYASLPFKLHQPSITVSKKSNTFYLTANSNYASYKWSTGATTQTIKVTQPGSYYVFVPKGKGGFICSQLFKLSASDFTKQ